VVYGFSIGIDIGDLNDTERHNSSYFALFHRIRQLWRLITSQWLKTNNVRKISSPRYIWPKLTHAAVDGLFATAVSFLLIFISFFHIYTVKCSELRVEGQGHKVT